jgi:hypothetical protein
VARQNKEEEKKLMIEKDAVMNGGVVLCYSA